MGVFGVGPTLRRTLQRRWGIMQPSKIQNEVLPLALAGKDVLCCAQTGSGKTLAFLLPMVQRLAELRPRERAQKALWVQSEPEALVLMPTKELANQVARVASDLVSDLVVPPQVLALTGGEQYTPQKRSLREGNVRLLVATPERLLYHIEQKSVSLRSVRWLAIDEADSMLCAADGITRETDQVLEKLHERRINRKPPQAILASATISQEHEDRARAWFPNLHRVSHVGVLVATLRKRFIPVRGFKDEELLRLLEKSWADPWLRGGGTIIFCIGGNVATRVHELIQTTMPWLNPVLIHGEVDTQERQVRLRAFAEDDTRLLVTSDVVARGLDFVEVRHVVMYDAPRDLNTFIHRAGRTARTGKEGLVSCLMWPKEYTFYNQVRFGDDNTALQASGGRNGRERALPTPVLEEEDFGSAGMPTMDTSSEEEKLIAEQQWAAEMRWAGSKRSTTPKRTVDTESNCLEDGDDDEDEDYWDERDWREDKQSRRHADFRRKDGRRANLQFPAVWRGAHEISTPDAELQRARNRALSWEGRSSDRLVPSKRPSAGHPHVRYSNSSNSRPA
ncbi:hypothetical protein AB1Y20_020208 [Prymnesium parvum]|uniref:ATP-dependent RNA helicase n=1 Tax=Prymnesium parvum TaxID=97485 RepID=A0AB34JSV2_PRYPA